MTSHTLDDVPNGTPRYVALFLADLTGGGAERAVLNLGGGIARRGHRVDLVLAAASGAFIDEIPGEVNVVDLRADRVRRAIAPLARYLRRQRPDVMLSTLHHACVAASVANAVSRTYTTVFLRESSTPSARAAGTLDVRARVLRAAMHWAYARAAGVIAVSDGVANDLRSVFDVPAEKLWTLYNPIVTNDLERMAAVDPRHPWFGVGEPPVVLGVGRLRDYKGFLTLLDAFARVRAERAVRLMVLGEGPQREELEARAAALGIGGDVVFPGFVANPFSYMRRASVYVLSSHFEGLPGTLIQAMACGCPVVATDCRSGPAEILADGRFGDLVGVGDTHAMAEAIVRSLEEPRVSAADLRARAARYAVDPVVSAHLAAFEQVLAQSHATPGAGSGQLRQARDPS